MSIIEKQRVCSPGLASFPLKEIEDKINNFTATAFGCLRHFYSLLVSTINK